MKSFKTHVVSVCDGPLLCDLNWLYLLDALAFYRHLGFSESAFVILLLWKTHHVRSKCKNARIIIISATCVLDYRLCKSTIAIFINVSWKANRTFIRSFFKEPFSCNKCTAWLGFCMKNLFFSSEDAKNWWCL